MADSKEVAKQQEQIQSFFEEVTSELLYNIVHDHEDDDDEIGYKELSEEFEEKVGYQPMDFFGLGNITNEGWFEFLKESYGLSLDRRYISIDEGDQAVYEDYHTSFLLNTQQSVAEYREMLLIKACELIAKDGDANVKNRNKDSGNTPLHLVAALPGIDRDEPTLFRCLLQAGADPLQENKEGLNVLHIIAGRMKAEEDQEDKVYFGSERVQESSWEIGYRQALLKILRKKVSSAHLAMLMSRPGRDGNTVIHEWVLSASDVNLLGEPTVSLNEIKIAWKLLTFGGNVKIPNKLGLVPLHFAYNSAVFKFLLQKGAVCRSRNEQDETPFLFILKLLVSLAFQNISGAEEIKKLADTRTPATERNSVQWLFGKALQVLKHLINSVDESEELRKTVWIPDMEDISPLEVVLVSVRTASYALKPKYISSKSEDLRKYLVELLHRILRSGSPDHLRRQNKKGQSPLHMLLDLGSNNPNKIIVDTEIIQCLQALLANGADVNAANSRAQTALDVLQKYSVKMPSLYTKCTEILRKNGAQDHPAVAVEDHDSATQQRLRFSNLTLFPVSNAKRKLRGTCPQRHLNTAEQLTDAKSPGVIVVQKYRYFSQRSIGSGGFSSIYVATKDEHEDKKSRTIDCRAVALKRLEKFKINPQEIKREVQALLSISTGCENILNCYDSFEDDFFHYLCLDLMDGDLQQFIDENRMRELVSPATTLQATKDITNGLTYLHKNDFLHRDLKPGNILYTIHPSLQFKIGDFGLAKSISFSATMTSTRGAMAPGTRCWMAPELVSLRSREHTKESDVFALGLVLHFLLSLGKHPFVGATEEPPHVIEKNLVDMKMSIDTSLSSEASHFIQTILAKNPSKRLPAAFLQQHPFLWSVKKKIEFLKAVGDQPEAVNPSNCPNSSMEKCLQKTNIGRRFAHSSWESKDQLQELFIEMTRTWKQKKYRTDNVIDLLRFLRNSYSHKEERSLNFKQKLDNNIFLKTFPSLVLEVYVAVKNEGMVDDPNRSNIQQALLML